MPIDFEQKKNELDQAARACNKRAVQKILEDTPELVDYLNNDFEDMPLQLAYIVVHRRKLKFEGNFSKLKASLEIIKILVQQGVKFNLKSDKYNDALINALDFKQYDLASYLLDLYVKEAGGDIQKLQSLTAISNGPRCKKGDNVFYLIRKAVIDNIDNSSDQHAARKFVTDLLIKYPQLKEPFALDSRFFIDEKEEKKSGNVSDAASLDPVKAVNEDGDEWQSSITPDSRPNKKTIVIDYSFLAVPDESSKKRRHDQIVRLVAEGFKVKTFDSNGKLVDLKENTLLYHIENEKKEEVSKDETLVISQFNAHMFHTLFYSPFDYLDIRGEASNYFKLLTGYYDDITKLPKDDPKYLIRTNQMDLISEKQIKELLNQERKIFFQLMLCGGCPQLQKYLHNHVTEFQEILREDGSSFLQDIIFHNNFRAVKLLIEANIDLNNIFPNAIVAAAWSGHKDIVEILIKTVDQDKCNKAFITASQKGHLDVVEILLNAGAKVNYKVNYKSDEGAYALMSASYGGQVEVVKTLLKAGADIEQVDKDGDNALLEACRKGHADVVTALLDAGANIEHIDHYGDNPLTTAAYYGQAEVVSILLSRNANINYATQRGFTALMTACHKGNAAVVELLLDAGANIKHKTEAGNTALTLAVERNNVEVVKVFLKREQYDNLELEDALISASIEGHTDIVKVLLDAKVDVNYVDKRGYNALAWASLMGNLEVVKILLDANANVNSNNKFGEIALSLASHKGHVDIIKTLLETGKITKKQKEKAFRHCKPELREEVQKIFELDNIKFTKKGRPNALTVNSSLLSGSFTAGSKKRGGSNMGSGGFIMVEIGEMLNNKKVDKLPYPVRTRVGIKKVSGNLFVDVKQDKSKNIFFNAEQISNLQNEYEDRKTNFKSRDDRAYFALESKVKAKTSTKLLSINYPAVIAGIKLSDGAKITKLFQDEFGFYHITTNKSCKIEYILEVDHKNIKDLNSSPIDVDLKRIIAEHKENGGNSPKPFRKKGFFEKTENYLDQAFAHGGGPCGVRTAAVSHKINKNAPGSFGKTRVADIDRNHVSLEIKTGDRPNDFIYVELGGESGEIIHKNTDEVDFFSSARRFKQSFINLAERVADSRIAAVIMAPFVAIAAPFVALRNGIGRIFRKKEDSYEVNERTELKDPTTNASVSIGQAILVDESNLNATIPSSIQVQPEKNNMRQAFENFVQKQSEKPQKLLPENVSQLFFSTRKPSLLITQNVAGCANHLIVQARAENAQRPVIFINSPKQLDIFKRTLKIKEDECEIEEYGFFADFIRQTRNYSGQQPPLLIINWSNFSARQRTAYNTIIDDRHPEIDGVDLTGIKVISLTNSEIDDQSFNTRHAEKFSADFSSILQNSNTSQSVQPLDLKGATNWRQQLFGRIHLQEDQVIWDKSDFVLALERGQENFTISNCSNIDECKKEIAQAVAAGYLFYQGKKIDINANFKITFATKNFDFTNFTAVAIAPNKKCEEVSSDCHIINTQIFDFLLRRKEISGKKYLEKPGLIKMAAQKSDKTLKLFITSNLSQAQYYYLFKEAQDAPITLDLSFAPNVDIPEYLRNFIAKTPPQESSQNLQIQSHLHVTKNPRLVEIPKDYLVIDVEDCSFQDLVGKISYEISGKLFVNFEQNPNNIIKYLKEGNKICLRGEFSTDLMQMLQPYLFQPYAQNLALIVEDKGKETQDALAYTNSVKTISADHLKLPRAVMYEKEAAALIHDLSIATDEELIQDALFFEHKRKEDFTRLLKSTSLLALQGKAGIGKTSLVQSQPNCHKGFENFDKWFSEGGILFLDEANILNSHLTMFEPLKEGGDKRIFFQGQFYQLDERHKVVFAYNPPEFGGGRAQEQKLFTQNGVQIFDMHELPACYIYYLLKTQIFEKSAFKDNKIVLKEFLQNCKKEIGNYQDTLGMGPPEEITIRELQENALKFLTRKLNNIPSNQDKPYAKEIAEADFVSTDATKAIENALGECLAVRKEQIGGRLPGGGTNGVLIEGGSGIGKSAMVEAYLEKEGRGYIKIDSSMLFATQKEKIIQAFETGGILWIDEIDTCISNGIETILNAALNGDHPNNSAFNSRSNSPILGSAVGQIDADRTKAGFTLFATSNGISHAGRKLLGPAIRSRLNCVRPSGLDEYKEPDIKKIISSWVVRGNKDEPSKKVEKDLDNVAKAYLSMQSKGGEHMPNLRVLRNFIEENFKEVAKESQRPSPSPSLSHQHKTVVTPFKINVLPASSNPVSSRA